MKIFSGLLYISLFLSSTMSFAQNFATGAQMLRYESLHDGSKSTVEYSYFYHDMEGETLHIKLLGHNTPSHLSNKIFRAVPHHPMSEDDAHEYNLMLKKFAINQVQLNHGCYFKGKASIEIIMLEEWLNHYDADGNTAHISLENISVSQPPIYKCDHQGDLYSN